MRKISFYKISLEIILILLVILWIYTGLTKMINYADTRFQMGRSPFIKPMAGFVAATLPAFEIIVAGLLVFKRTRLLGLYASFFLMLLFTGYIYAMLHYSYYVPCSCGGVLAILTWNQHLLFNTIYTLFALFGVILQTTLAEPLNLMVDPQPAMGQ
jgi:uncharacterized membrane protein YphA (DoxX/SURF4 family)